MSVGKRRGQEVVMILLWLADLISRVGLFLTDGHGMAVGMGTCIVPMAFFLLLLPSREVYTSMGIRKHTTLSRRGMTILAFGLSRIRLFIQQRRSIHIQVA